MSVVFARAVGLCIGLGATAIAIAPAVAQSTPSIDQQLMIQRHHFERSRSLNQAERLVTYAERQSALGQTERAIAAWQRAFEIYSTWSHPAGMQSTAAALAATLVVAERYPEAIAAIQHQLALAREQGDIEAQGYALNNLGTVYLHQGQLTAAQATFTAALERSEALGDAALMGLSLSNLGLEARQSGDLASAQTYHMAAADYRAQAGDTVGFARSSNNLGTIYRQLGQTEAALEAFSTARTAAMSASDVPTLQKALDGIIAIAADANDLVGLQFYVSERAAATPLMAPPDQQLGLAVATGLLAEQQGDYAEAQIAYEEAIAIAEIIDNPEQRRRILNRLQRLMALTDES
ncbi:MAG: tetratricopeptide repeat protein [Leptolyngbyaceae cyanobacterium]